jgi:predicted AlkP superfamily pyrophosphatase or phosphodiesterase
MNRLDIIFPRINSIFFSSLLLIPGCSSKSTASKDQNNPNVLIILADDLGYGDISCYAQRNYKTTNIDNLAGHGVSCTDFYVPTPYSAPSRTTLLTGRFPLRHGLINNPAPDAGINDVGINLNEITLGNVLSNLYPEIVKELLEACQRFEASF